MRERLIRMARELADGGDDMSFPTRRGCAAALALAVARVAPPERSGWAEAMQAEIEHLPDPAALSFAAGCLWAAIRARAASAAFVLHATRWTLVAGATGWGGMHVWLAGRLSVADASPQAALAYAAAGIYGLGALATALLGLRATIALITPVLALAASYAAGAAALIPQLPDTAFYRALAIEEVGVLLVTMVIALGATNWAAAQDRA